MAVGLASVAFVLPKISTRSMRVRSWLERIPFVGNLLVKLPAAQGIVGPVLAVILSIGSQSFAVLAVSAVLLPLAPEVTIGICARIVPVILLITHVPLTPGGIGQREAAFVHFLGLIHVEREAALATSLLFFAVTLTLSATGGLVLLTERTRAVLLARALKKQSLDRSVQK
jgi:uncharacterized membrane protein YbhN (UPF0104 family)